jgi:sucrose-6F-phosphate phosphohydrolase
VNPFLFVTDLDNTLVGDDLALAKLNGKLSEHRQEFGTKIVYATGRSLYLYQQLAEEKCLLSPDVLICAVGTEIYFNPDKNVYDSEWANLLSIGWNREQIADLSNKYIDLELQPESEQNDFKISYYLSQQASQKVLTQLHSDLADRGWQVTLIYSAGQDLDIIPQKSDKGLAVKFLRQKLGITADRTVVCGDSGNDIALFQGEERGIIVGNAKPELCQWYQNNKSDYRYLASSHCAAGIFEGLEYFGFI